MLAGRQLLGLLPVLHNCSCCAAALKAWKTKEVDDVSPGMFFVLITGLSLWVVYGVIQKDIPIIATNGHPFMLNSLMIFYNLNTANSVDQKCVFLGGILRLQRHLQFGSSTNSSETLTC